MNKKAFWITVLSLAAAVAAAFVVLLFLSIPIGNKASVISPVVLYVFGWTAAGLSLAAGAFFLLRIIKGS